MGVDRQTRHEAITHAGRDQADDRDDAVGLGHDPRRGNGRFGKGGIEEAAVDAAVPGRDEGQFAQFGEGRRGWGTGIA
ncbi:hypothetical protein D3C87_1984020 [compost metagenome]